MSKTALQPQPSASERESSKPKPQPSASKQLPPAPEQPPAPIYLTTQQTIGAYALGNLERQVQKQLLELRTNQCRQDPFLPCLQLELSSDQIETTSHHLSQDLDIINVNLLLPQEPSPFHQPPDNHLLDASWLISHLDLTCDVVSLHAKNTQTKREAFIFFNARDERKQRRQFEEASTKLPPISFTLKPLNPTQSGIDLIKLTITTEVNYPRITIENYASEQIRTRVDTYKALGKTIGIYPNSEQLYNSHITLTTYTPV